jgi:hypothetical protein
MNGAQLRIRWLRLAVDGVSENIEHSRNDILPMGMTGMFHRRRCSCE